MTKGLGIFTPSTVTAREGLPGSVPGRCSAADVTTLYSHTRSSGRGTQHRPVAQRAGWIQTVVAYPPSCARGYTGLLPPQGTASQG